MPADIVVLQKKPRCGADSLDGSIRKYLQAVSEDPGLVESVAARMKAYIDEYASLWFNPSFNLAVPAGISDKDAKALLASVEAGIDRAAEQVNETISRIIIERMMLEVQLVKADNMLQKAVPIAAGKKRRQL